MSNAIWPVLSGLAWNVIKAPQWSTKVQRSVGGKELRAAFWSAPIYTWSLTYELLRANALAEFQTLIGFFNARQGKFDSFLFTDPADNSVTAQNFGTGDAVKTAFQLKRTFGGNDENVFDLNGVATIIESGVTKTSLLDYIISSTALVTFMLAPPAAAPSGVGSGTGGTLAAATYYGKVAALNAAGESIGSAESVGVVTTGATSSIVWSWGAVTGATSYSLYVGTAPTAENTKVALGNVLTYTQTAALAGGSPLGTPTAARAPANAAALTWTGNYYWRVRFADDSADFNNFLYQLWELKKISLVSVKV